MVFYTAQYIYRDGEKRKVKKYFSFHFSLSTFCCTFATEKNKTSQ